eukprot:1217042-Alexandrium_andersonii.AAC.1
MTQAARSESRHLLAAQPYSPGYPPHAAARDECEATSRTGREERTVKRQQPKTEHEPKRSPRAHPVPPM